MRMHNIKHFAALVLLALAGCASTPRIAVDSRPNTDFAAYKTYAFVTQPGTDREGYTTILTGHFKAALQAEMQARGYRLVSDNPDLQLNFFSNVEHRSETRSSPRLNVGYIHYRGGISIGFPIANQDLETRNYKVGTITIDVVDARHKELIWEGVLEGALSRKALENPAAAVQSAVTQIFARFPVAKSGVASVP
jgi:Domain of unknown function (DUF4136)